MLTDTPHKHRILPYEQMEMPFFKSRFSYRKAILKED